MNTQSLPKPGTHVNEVLSGVRISDVYRALGGPQPRMNRGPAFWRPKSDNPQAVSLNDAKGVWKDFVSGEGGGILALIQSARDLQKRDALKWLADFQGIQLDSPLTLEQRRQYARETKAAEAEAREFVAWKRDMVDALREKRNGLLETYHASKRFLFRYSEEACRKYGGLLEFKLECAWEVQFTYWRKIEDLDRRIALIEQAPFATLLPFFRSRTDEQVAA